MRNRRRIMVWVVVAVALAVSVGACASNGPKIIKLAGKGSVAGEVTFSHGKHAGDMEEGGYYIACDKCHHQIWQQMGQPSRNCRTCHRKGSVKPPSMEEAAHKQCMECHEELKREDPKRKVPASCPDCHGSGKPEKK